MCINGEVSIDDAAKSTEVNHAKPDDNDVDDKIGENNVSHENYQQSSGGDTPESRILEGISSTTPIECSDLPTDQSTGTNGGKEKKSLNPEVKEPIDVSDGVIGDNTRIDGGKGSMDKRSLDPGAFQSTSTKEGGSKPFILSDAFQSTSTKEAGGKPFNDNVLNKGIWSPETRRLSGETNYSARSAFLIAVLLIFGVIITPINGSDVIDGSTGTNGGKDSVDKGSLKTDTNSERIESIATEAPTFERIGSIANDYQQNIMIDWMIIVGFVVIIMVIMAIFCYNWSLGFN